MHKYKLSQQRLISATELHSQSMLLYIIYLPTPLHKQDATQSQFFGAG